LLKKKLNTQLQKLTQDSDFSEILSKGASYIAIRGVGILLSYGLTIFIARMFNSSVLGLYSVCISIFMIVSTFGTLGLDLNVVRYYSADENKKDSKLFYKLIVKSFVLSSLLSLLIFSIRYTIAIDLFKVAKPELVPYLNWILLSIPFWSVTLICAGVSRANTNIITFSFISQTSRYLFSFLMIVFLSYVSDSPLITAKAHFYGILVTSIVAFLITVSKFKKTEHSIQTNSWGFIRDSLPMMLSSSILIFLGWIDTFILGVFELESNVGIYNVCLKIATFSTLTLLAINSILAPKIAKSYNENNQSHYKKLIHFSAKLNFFISSVVIGLIVIFNEFLLGIFGDEYIVGKTILIILCIGQMTNSFAGSVGIILQMIGKQKVYQNFILIALLLNIALTLMLTPRFGGIGAATATVLSMMFWNIGAAVYLKYKEGIISFYNPMNIFFKKT